MHVKRGDTIEVLSNKVDAPPRRGKVIEILSDEPVEWRVAWDDGHESVMYPNTGMIRVLDRN